MVSIHRRIGGVLILLLLLVASCVPQERIPCNEHSNCIIYGLTLEPSGIDPHINRSSELGIVLRQVYDTLVYRDPVTQDFVPGLAQEWTISEDGLVYTFILREDVTFHDGTPFNAAAVAINLDRILSDDTASQWARFLLGPFNRYEVVDDFTIRFVLSEPYAPLLDAISQVYLGMASPSALEEYSLLRYQFHQVGTGPFIFEEYLPGDRIVVRRNSNYTWGPDFYQSTSDSGFEIIEYRFFRDEATRAVALEDGRAQVMGEILPVDARALTGNSNVQLVPVNVPGQPLQFFMNTTNYPTDNLTVRRALIYATNRSAIINSVFQSFSPIAWGPLSANMPYYNRGVRDMYAYDIGQAQSLLATIGFADTDDDSWLDFDGVPLEIKMIVPPWGAIPDVAQLIQDQWRTIGIRTVLEPVPNFTTLREAVLSGDYHLVAFNSFGVDPVILNDSYLSNGTTNWTGYGTAQLDSILLEAARQLDPIVRRDLYGQAQAIIMDQALILPIRDYVNLNGHVSTVTNLSYDATGWFPLMPNVMRLGE